MALPDATEEAPVRRMTVVRGTIQGPAPQETDFAMARAAAALAAKQAHTILPACPVVAPTHVDVQFNQGDAIECTVTVQAFARTSLEPQALLALQAALLALGSGPISMDVVQSVA